MLKRVIFILSGAFMLNACMKDVEEDETYPVTSIPEEVLLETIPMTESYSRQFYYDLSENRIVHENDKNEWDLAFENTDQGQTIWLNTANFMEAGSTENSFDELTSSAGISMSFDDPSGSADSTAIGAWWSKESMVYVINRGIDENGSALGYKKVVFSMPEQDVYTIRFANLDGSNEHTVEVAKNAMEGRIMWSFDDGGKIAFTEPEEWDLWFTQYTKTLFAEGEPYPYLVVGALTNRPRIASARLSRSFENVSLADADTVTWFPYADVIGYDWKELTGDVESGDVSYVIPDTNIYLLRVQKSEDYYKLRFTDFYDETGRKGYPAFEYMQLLR